MEKDNPKKILYVDDKDYLRTTAEEILGFNGYEVKSSTPEDAHQLYDCFKPDLVILDTTYENRGYSGLDLADKIYGTPVIGISGNYKLEEGWSKKGKRFVYKPNLYRKGKDEDGKDNGLEVIASAFFERDNKQ